MTLLAEQTVTEIGGKTYTIRKLNFHESLPVYCKFQRLMAAYFDEEKAVNGLAIFQLVGFAGGLTHEDLKFYIEAFGPSTSVQFADGRVLALKRIPATKTKPEVDPVAEAFEGALDEMFLWLDECVRYNYGTLIEKTAGAMRSDEDNAAPKAKPTDQPE